MRNSTSATGRQHQLVLSLSPHCLNIVHLQRGLIGWRQTNSAQMALSEGDDFLPQIQSHLSQSVAQWRLPPAVATHWILAGDILGIIQPPSSDPSAAAALPFNSNDTRTQPDQFTNTDTPSLMWMHKDWIAEIERISSHSQLTLVEIYARAQLFQRHAARFTGELKIVIELDADQYFLHIFSSSGMMLRTRVLGDIDTTAVHSLLLSEIAGLESNLDEGHSRKIHLLAPAGLVSSASKWEGFHCSSMPELAQADLLEQLWRSDLEGIVVRPTYEAVVGHIKLLSIVMGALGLAGLGLMAWHDGKLQNQIEEDRAQARKDLPAVEAAKKLKRRTIQIADAIGAAKSFREDTVAMAAFSQILANFPPAPATLLYIRTDQKSLAFAGTGDEASVKWIQEKSFLGYEPLVELPVPDFLENNNPIIRFQSRKSSVNGAGTLTRIAPPVSAPASMSIAP